MNNSMVIEASISFATLGMNTAAYLEGLPGGEMSTEIRECGLEVTLDVEDPMTAHIKYTDGFPDSQTISLAYWKPGCTKSLTNVQFTRECDLLDWVQEHMPDCVPTMYELAVKSINIQEDDGLQLIGLRTPNMFAVVGCTHPLELVV